MSAGRKKPSAHARPSAKLVSTHRTRRVYVDPVDWNDVLAGLKTEVRVYGRQRLKWIDGEMPMPCLLWTKTSFGSTKTALGVIEDKREEPLGAISAESLRREGFNSDDHKQNLSDFRRYFAARYPNGGYRPMASVMVTQLHAMTEEERQWAAEYVFQAVYGRFL